MIDIQPAQDGMPTTYIHINPQCCSSDELTQHITTIQHTAVYLHDYNELLPPTSKQLHTYHIITNDIVIYITDQYNQQCAALYQHYSTATIKLYILSYHVYKQNNCDVHDTIKQYTGCGFNNCTLTLSGYKSRHGMDVHNQLYSLVQQLQFNIPKQFSSIKNKLLITATVATKQYRAVYGKLHCSCLIEQYVYDCWAQGRFINELFDYYTPLLYGLVIYIDIHSGYINHDETEKYIKLIGQHGGTYCTELCNKYLSHIICKSMNDTLQLQIDQLPNKSSVHIVTHQWLIDMCNAVLDSNTGIVDEKKYCAASNAILPSVDAAVQSSVPKRSNAMILSTKYNSMESPKNRLRSISDSINTPKQRSAPHPLSIQHTSSTVQSAVQHKLTRAQLIYVEHNNYIDNMTSGTIDLRLPVDCHNDVKFNKSLLTQFLYKPADGTAQLYLLHNKSNQFMSSCTVVLYGWDHPIRQLLLRISCTLTPHRQSYLTHNIEQLCDTNTYVVVPRRSIVTDYYKSYGITTIPNKIQMVSYNWLLQCYIDQLYHPVGTYILPVDTPINQPITQSTRLQTTQSRGITDRTVSLLNATHSDKNKLLRKSMTNLTKQSAIQMNSDTVNIFQNKLILLSCGKKDTRKQWQEQIIRYGGRCMSTHECAVHLSADFIVADVWSINHRNEYTQLHINHVKPSWIDLCIQYKQLVMNDITVMNIPRHANKTIIPQFSTLKLCCTGFGTIDEREPIINAIQQCGATYSDILDTSVSYLVCKLGTGDKYNHAIKHNITCVDVQWLARCLWTGRLLSVTDYPVKPYNNTMNSSEIMKCDSTGIIPHTHSDASNNHNTTLNDTISTAFAQQIKHAVTATSTDSQLNDGQPAVNGAYINDQSINDGIMSNNVDELEEAMSNEPFQRSIPTISYDTNDGDVSELDLSTTQHNQPILCHSTTDINELDISSIEQTSSQPNDSIVVEPVINPLGSQIEEQVDCHVNTIESSAGQVDHSIVIMSDHNKENQSNPTNTKHHHSNKNERQHTAQQNTRNNDTTAAIDSIDQLMNDAFNNTTYKPTVPVIGSHYDNTVTSPSICLCSCTADDTVQLTESIVGLGGIVVDTESYDTCDYIVTESLVRKCKILIGVLRNIPLIKKQYIHDSSASNQWLPLTNKYQHNIKHDIHNILSAQQYWSNRHLPLPFTGWSCYLHTVDKHKSIDFYNILKCGGASYIHLSTDKHINKKSVHQFTHIFLDESIYTAQLYSDNNIQLFVSTIAQSVAIYNTTYIVDYICNPINTNITGYQYTAHLISHTGVRRRSVSQSQLTESPNHSQNTVTTKRSRRN